MFYWETYFTFQQHIRNTYFRNWGKAHSTYIPWDIFLCLEQNFPLGSVFQNWQVQQFNLFSFCIIFSNLKKSYCQGFLHVILMHMDKIYHFFPKWVILATRMSWLLCVILNAHSHCIISLVPSQIFKINWEDTSRKGWKVILFEGKRS